MNALIRPRFEKSGFLECKGTEYSAMQGHGNEGKNTLWNFPVDMGIKMPRATLKNHVPCIPCANRAESICGPGNREKQGVSGPEVRVVGAHLNLYQEFESVDLVDFGAVAFSVEYFIF